MKRLAAIFLLLALAACATVPITGRQQVNLLPNVRLNAQGLSEYRKFLTKNEVVRNTGEARSVRYVGQRIQKAVEEYFRSRGDGARLDGYEWEFNLVESEDKNAFCMPGGKVAVMTGLLPVAQNETGLAVVMGHEIAHAVANHGNERMSQALLLQTGSLALGSMMGEDNPQRRDAFLTAFGVGAQLGVLLPFSRTHEAEADHLGLIFMAMAGFDPRASVGFWERMSRAAREKEAPPEFLSTHPADQTRIANLERAIPEALRYYRSGEEGRPARKK